MKKVICFFLILIFPINVLASTKSARSIAVLDLDSGRILFQKNINEKRLIASITKMMTAIISLENSPNLNKKITVGEEVLRMYGTNIYIEVGEKITIKDLLYGLLLRSGNDAAITLSKNIKGEKKFVESMNEKAKELGMDNTTFNNPHGLDEETKNYSTAYDMAVLSRYVSKNKYYKKITSTKKYQTKTNEKTYLWYNRNKLLSLYKYCNGGKNGYTPKAGKTLVTTATKNNMSLTIVTLDDDDEYNTHEKLYEEMFRIYQNYTIVDKDTFKVDKSFYNKNIYLKKSFIYPLTIEETNHIKTEINLPNIKSTNEVVGNIKIKLNDKVIGYLNIYQKNNQKKESTFTKISNSLKKLFIR